MYRDYGGVPGVDMVFISNGHVYHTALDTPERIDRGSVQRAGENVLAVTQALVKSPFMVDAKWTRLQVSSCQVSIYGGRKVDAATGKEEKDGLD